MTTQRFETPQEQLQRLRSALAQAQTELIEAEARLADQLAETNAFEFELESRVGHLVDKLEALETEIENYNERIQMLRNKELFGYAYRPADQQYRRTWQAPPRAAATPPAWQPSPGDEARIKQMYRQLARRFHPDLAQGETDRARRTEMMAAVNDAYAARSLTELEALAREPDYLIDTGRPPAGQTTAELIQVLQNEVERCQRRLREIESEMAGLSQRSSVQLSLEVKLARRQGRDLLAEMAADLERRIARRSVERDMLKAQFDQLGPDQGIIPINR